MAGKNWNHTISCLGDSLFHHIQYGVPIHQFAPYQLQLLLQALGCNVLVRNLGLPGDPTGPFTGKKGMILRQTETWMWGVPDIGVVYGGTNDKGLGIAQAETQANLQTIIGNWVAKGVNKIVVCGNHIQNFSSTFGGDVVSGVPKVDTDSYYGAQIAAQKAAVVASQLQYPNATIVYADLYNYMVNLLVQNPTWANNGTAFHLTDGNYHLGPNGELYVAQAILQAMPANWISSLKS